MDLFKLKEREQLLVYQGTHWTGRKSRGFTLLEIVIAVAVLSISLITLLGLQAAATSEAVRTRNKQQAMLMARSIMTNIELDLDVLKDSSIQAPAEELLNQYGTPDPNDKTEKKPLDQVPLFGELEIKTWNIPGVPDDSLRRIKLRVSWSNNPADSIEVLYFVPIP